MEQRISPQNSKAAWVLPFIMGVIASEIGHAMLRSHIAHALWHLLERHMLMSLLAVGAGIAGLGLGFLWILLLAADAMLDEVDRMRVCSPADPAMDRGGSRFDGGFCEPRVAVACRALPEPQISIDRRALARHWAWDEF